MKKNILSFLLVCGLVTVAVSCAKEVEADSTDTSTSTSSSSSFSAKINGSSFSVNTFSVSESNDILSFVAGSSTQNKSVGIFMPSTVAAGTYPTTETGQFRITYTGPATQNNLYSAKDNGTITITSHNTTSKIIKGTFSADATHISAGAANDTIKMRDGEFIIVY